MKATKSLLFILLAGLLLALCVTAAFAVGGNLGAVEWDYNETTKTLTFSGTGAIPDYPDSDARPWLAGIAGQCETVVIENGVTDVGQNAFSGFNALQSVTMTDSVKTIGNDAFLNCGQLISAAIGNRVTSIGSSAFDCCYKLETVTGGSSVALIGFRAFCNCQKLKTFTLSSSVTNIGNSAFENCYVLENVTIPPNVKSIGNRVFYRNHEMQAASIPEGVTSIGNEAFFDCSGLQTVSIPSSATSIGDKAFAIQLEKLEKNNALKTVKYAGSETQWNALGKGQYVFGVLLSDSTYRERTAQEKPTFQFNVASAKVTLFTSASNPHILAGGGTVTGSGSYEIGKQVVITATPVEGYVFDGWYGVHEVEGRLTSKQYGLRTQVITLTGNVTLAALFVKATSSDYTVTVTATEGGTASAGGVYHPGQTAQITAMPDSGWHFVGWFDGETKVTSSANYAFDVEKNVTMTARFEADKPEPEPDPEPEPAAPPQSVCPWCGGVHEGFFQSIVGWFHSIFAKLFGARF